MALLENSIKCKTRITHFVSIPLLQTFEYGLEGIVYDVQNLVIMVVEGHFKIEANELRKMPMGVRVLCPENCAPVNIVMDAQK